MSRSRFVVASMLGVSLVVAPFSSRNVALAQTTGLNTVEAIDAETPRYYGLHFDLGVYDGSGLNNVGENYRNDLSFYFEPSWDIGRVFKNLRNTRWKTLQLSGRFVVSANVSGTDEAYFSGNTAASPQGTCSDVAPTSNGGVVSGAVPYCNPSSATRRADYSDFWFTLRAPAIYKIPKLDININPAFRIILPSSEESRYATLIASITPSLGLSRALWKNRVRLGISFGVTKNFQKSATAQYTGSTSSTVSTEGGNPYDGPLSQGVSNFYADPSRQSTIGGLNTNFALLSVFSGGVNFTDKWSFDALYIVSNAFPYGQDCNQTVQGVTVNLCQTGSAVATSSGTQLWRPGRRDNQTFWATINYQPFDWIGFSVAWINSAPMYKPDSTYRQGFISTDYNSFTTISLGTTISIDHVADAINKRRARPVNPLARANGVSLQ